MTKWIAVGTVFWALVIAAGITFKVGMVRVEPNEVVFVIKNGQVAEAIRPGLHWTWPYFRSVAYVSAPFRFQKQTVDLVGLLSDGSKCPIKAILQYRIGAPRRAIEWRLANKKDVSRKSMASGRNDYVEPKRLFKRMLLPVMKQITPQKAARGAVEAWIRKNDVKKMRSIKNSDGTRISGIRAMTVGCSKNKHLGVRYKSPVIKFGHPQKFKKKQRKKFSGEVHKSLGFFLDIVLQGKRSARSVRIDNLVVEYVIVNEKLFSQGFGIAEKRYLYAGARIYTEVKIAIRKRAMIWGKIENVQNIDLTQLFRPGSDLAKIVEKGGVRVVNIATDETHYRLQIKKED